MSKFVQPPTVAQNPNKRVPLVAVVHLRTGEPAEVNLTVDDGRKKRTITYPANHDQDAGYPIIGMRADTDHKIIVDVAGGEPAMLTYRTPPLPLDSLEMPRLTTVAARTAAMEPGFTLLSIRRRPVTRAIWNTERQFMYMTRWSLLVALDEEGEVVWYYTADSRIAGVHQLKNGNLFFHHVNFRSIEMDLCGNVVNQFHATNRPWGPVENSIGIEAESLHHQPHEMPNGNYLALTANARTFENYYSSEFDADAPRERHSVVGDNIVEFTPAGEIVWNWNSFDHLDPFRIGYHTFEVYWHTRGFPNHLDWTHGNGVTYDPNDDSIIVSLRHQDALIKIDRASKDILWILGDHRGWGESYRDKLLTPVGGDGEFRWHYHGHNPRVTRDGTIVMYDNGIVRAIPFHDDPKPPSECFARAIEYEVDARAKTVREVWVSSTDQSEDRVVSWAMGDAHRLPETGNMLVIDSFCLPTGDKLHRFGDIGLADLTWNEWKRDEWHPSDFPYWGRIREMTRDEKREVLFEVHVDHPHDISGWEVFGGARVKSLYPAGVVSDRSE